MGIVKEIVLSFVFILTIVPATMAQWVGGDGPPVEPAHKNVAFLGSDKTPPSATGHVGVVEVYGEGNPTPPVYVVTPEKIAALKLNKGQEAVLNAEFPDFVPWTLADYGDKIKYYPFSKRQLPYGISWDYDGKNHPATVIVGHDKLSDYSQNYIVFLRPEKNGYKLIKWKSGFVDKYNHSGQTAIVLRLIKPGSIVDVGQECGPSIVEKLWHTGFADIDLSISTEATIEQQFKSANRIVYYREGLSLVDNANISGIQPGSSFAFNKKVLKDITPNADMQRAIEKYKNGFKIWNNSDYSPISVSSYQYSGNSMPYAIQYDLNGDGIDDMVVAGHDSDSNMVLELLSGTSGYSVREIAGTEESCYSHARERKETLGFRPSHILALYKKGAGFAHLEPKATDGFWHYNGDVLIGMREFNTCVKHLESPFRDMNDPCVETEKYDKWRPRKRIDVCLWRTRG
jgi:hypothetical protein